MTAQSITDVETLRAALKDLKREVAKVIAAMQLGGDRPKRRELSKRLTTCRKRAKALESPTNALLQSLEGGASDARAELEQALRFLAQMRTLGTGQRE